MTISQLISLVKEEKPNAFKTSKLLEIINRIEAEVADQLQTDIPMYTEDDMDAELLVPMPYSNLYISYLKAQIDKANEELESYENNRAQHDQDFRDFIDWSLRSGRVASKPITRFKNIL